MGYLAGSSVNSVVAGRLRWQSRGILSRFRPVSWQIQLVRSEKWRVTRQDENLDGSTERAQRAEKGRHGVPRAEPRRPSGRSQYEQAHSHRSTEVPIRKHQFPGSICQLRPALMPASTERSGEGST